MLGNPYFIGFLLLLGEVAINYSFGSTVISSVTLGYAAGAIFVWKNEKRMVFSDKVKVLVVYLIPVLGISLVSIVTDGSSSFMIFVTLFFVVLSGLFTYLTMTLGSYLTYEALKKKKV